MRRPRTRARRRAGSTTASPDLSRTEPRLYRTSNGGVSWTQVTLPDDVGNRPSAVAFADEDHGWVSGRLGGAGSVHATGDGGRTWGEVTLPSKVDSVTGIDLWDGERAQVEANTARGDGMVLSTRDGGEAWSEIAVPQSSSVAIVTKDVAVIAPDAGGGPLRRTIDGGMTWLPLAGNDPPGDPHIAAAGGRHVVVGAGEYVLVSDDAGLTWQRRKT